MDGRGLRRCALCGVYAYRGFTRRYWPDVNSPLWVCQRVVECERRRKPDALAATEEETRDE